MADGSTFPRYWMYEGIFFRKIAKGRNRSKMVTADITATRIADFMKLSFRTPVTVLILM